MQILEIRKMKYVIFPKFGNNRQQNNVFANLCEHSKDRYFTVKSFQIKKFWNLVELGNLVFLADVKIPKMTK